MWCTGVVSSYLLTFRERVDRHVGAISNESHELENVVEDDTNILLIIGIVDMKLARQNTRLGMLHSTVPHSV